MRGKAFFVYITVTQNRITPAHAGKSSSDFVGFVEIWDHPRTCGEKFGFRKSDGKAVGSPPHMRGKEAY